MVIPNPHDPAKNFPAWIDHERRFSREHGREAEANKRAMGETTAAPPRAPRPALPRASALERPADAFAARLTALAVCLGHALRKATAASSLFAVYLACLLALAAACYGVFDGLARHSSPDDTASSAAGFVLRISTAACRGYESCLNIAGGVTGHLLGRVAAAGNGGARLAMAAIGREAPALSVSRAFEDGATDRRAWETWFAGLSGDARAGAEFWAGERSRRFPRRCESTGIGSPTFVMGCRIARSFLDPVDAKRRSEPNYWRGWNSY